MNVVFGATGAMGAAIVRLLCAGGKPVRAAARNADKARALLPEHAQILACDALDAAASRDACEGAGVVYNCVNVPYEEWGEKMPRVVGNVLAAAKAHGARLVFPGNVYGYGPFQSLPVTEDHPRAATGKKGRLRNEMEAAMMAAHRAGDVRVVIPRLPDFFGPNVTNPLFGGMFRSALAGKKVVWIGRTDLPRDLVFIDDGAAACVLLGETESAYGQDWLIPGPGAVTMQEFIGMVCRQAGYKPGIAVYGSTLFGFMAFFMTPLREIKEIMWQFEEPYELSGDKFAAAFPDFRFTPHEEAIRVTLEWFRAHPE